jgi:hypothetical protein
MEPLENKLMLAKVNVIGRGPHTSMLHELIFILSNPVVSCPHGPTDGPLGALGQIIHSIYLDYQANLNRRRGCSYSRTCLSAPRLGCQIEDLSPDKVIQFRRKM